MLVRLLPAPKRCKFRTQLQVDRIFLSATTIFIRKLDATNFIRSRYLCEIHWVVTFLSYGAKNEAVGLRLAIPFGINLGNPCHVAMQNFHSEPRGMGEFYRFFEGLPSDRSEDTRKLDS